MTDEVLTRLIDQLSSQEQKLTAEQEKRTQQVLTLARAQLALPQEKRYTRMAVLLHEAQRTDE